MQRGLTSMDSHRNTAHECVALRDLVSKLKQELLLSKTETEKAKDQFQCLIYLVRRAWSGDDTASRHVANIVEKKQLVSMSNEQEQLCGVDSNTGQILYYFNPSTRKVKWVDQPSKDISMQIPTQVPSQTSSGFDTEELPQSAKLGNLEDNGTPSDGREHVQTQIESTDECSYLISEELVTVALESCRGSDEKAESSSSVIMESNSEIVKGTWEQAPTDIGSCLGDTDSAKRKSEQLLSEKTSDMKFMRTIDTRTNNVIIISRDAQTEGTGQEPASDNQPTALFTPDDNDVEDNHHVHVHKESNITRNGTADGEISKTPQPERLWYKNHSSKCFKKCSIVATELGTNSDDKPRETCFRESNERTEFVDKPYECPQGEKSYSSPSRLATHVPAHTGVKLYKCKQCGKCFKQSGSLTKHVRVHTGERPYRCKQCGKCFKESGNLTKHVRIHSKEMILNKLSVHVDVDVDRFQTPQPEKAWCKDHCSKCFKRCNIEATELGTHPDDKPFLCKECEKCFRESDGRTESVDKPYECPQGEKSFSSPSRLATRVPAHTGGKLYKCKQCGKCFKQSGSLTKHVRVHTGERPYNCKQCGKCFKESGNLTKHVRIHSKEMILNKLSVHVDVDRIQTPQPETAWYKDHCSKCFKRCDIEATELGRHPDDKPFLCKECEKCFRDSDGRTESVDKPYECPQGEKSFSSPSRLATRVPAHTGEKLYKCKQCGKCFKQSGSLTKHVRVHTGERPYNCKQCGKCFKESGNLTKHVRIHLKEVIRNKLSVHIDGDRIQTPQPEKTWCKDRCSKCFKRCCIKSTQLGTNSDKPFLCKECETEKCFNESHGRTEFADQPYMFPQGEKSFGPPKRLASRVPAHTGVKLYKCKQCGKCFKQSGSLTKHVRVHTGERPYRCKQCGKCFKESGNLTKHIRIHSREMIH